MSAAEEATLGQVAGILEAEGTFLEAVRALPAARCALAEPVRRMLREAAPVFRAEASRVWEEVPCTSPPQRPGATSPYLQRGPSTGSTAWLLEAGTIASG